MREDFILNPLIDLQPMKILESRRYVMKFGSFGDSTSRSIENELKAVCLKRRKVQEKRVTLVSL